MKRYFDNILGFFVTPGVRFILMATVGVSVAQWILDFIFEHAITLQFGLSWGGIQSGKLWQPITYLFLHGNFLHLLLNLLGLVFFGPEVERALGRRRFLCLYAACGIVAGIGWMLLTPTPFPCVGASGAIFGVLGVFAALFPERPVTLLVFFVLPVTMKARTLAILLALITLGSMVGQEGNIAYAAHLAGGVAGYLYGLTLHRYGRPWPLPNPRHWINDLRWHWQRRKFKVIRPGDPDELRAEPRSPKTVDEILDKISRQGMGSLTRDELETLNRASRK